MDTQQLERPITGLNPHFRAKIPEMVETLSQIILAVRPHLAEAEIVSGQFADHHQFEIDKARLRLAMMNWESKVDPEEMAEAERHLRSLVEQLDMVGTPDLMRSSFNRIEALKVILLDLLEAG